VAPPPPPAARQRTSNVPAACATAAAAMKQPDRGSGGWGGAPGAPPPPGGYAPPALYPPGPAPGGPPGGPAWPAPPALGPGGGPPPAVGGPGGALYAYHGGSGGGGGPGLGPAVDSRGLGAGAPLLMPAPAGGEWGGGYYGAAPGRAGPLGARPLAGTAGAELAARATLGTGTGAAHSTAAAPHGPPLRAPAPTPRPKGAPNEYGMGTDLMYASRAMRHGFLRKVLGIVAAQLLLTAAVAAPILLLPGPQKWFSANRWALPLALIVTFGTLIALVCSEGARRAYPTNLVLLGVFTAAQGVLVGVACAAYDTPTVLLAVVLTAAVCVALVRPGRPAAAAGGGGRGQPRGRRLVGPASEPATTTPPPSLYLRPPPNPHRNRPPFTITGRLCAADQVRFHGGRRHAVQRAVAAAAGRARLLAARPAHAGPAGRGVGRAALLVLRRI
jgi:hypothetical protein